MSGQVHYELFSRKTPQAGWTLQMAVEDRDIALASAEDMLTAGHVAAVKVTKEVFSRESGEFRSYVLLTKGAPEQKTRARPTASAEPVCTAPQDLYSRHARETVSRVLEDWLRRQGVTAFELLHRPDLCERLDASANDLTHAIQKIAVPEAQEMGQSVHEIMRRWTALADKALARVVADGRRHLFPDLDPAGDILAQVGRIAAGPERTYVLGGALARLMSGQRSAKFKLEQLLAIITPVAARADDFRWAMEVLEAPITDIFARRAAIDDILGEAADLGTCLSVLTRMAAGTEVDLVGRLDPQVLRILPPIEGVLLDYSVLMKNGHFSALRQQIFRSMMVELRGVRRLRPGDAVGEIETLRALAMALTAVGGEQHQREDVTDAFIERSKLLVSSSFVSSLTEGVADATEEIERLVWLCENVAGAANKRQAARWLMSALTGLKFERDLRDPKRPAGQKLAALAALQKRLAKAQMGEKDAVEAETRLGYIGGLIAQDTHLIAHVVKGAKTPLQRVVTLLSFATAEAGPTGPLCDQAKAEVMKQLRTPDVREYLMGDPKTLGELRPLLVRAGLAA